MASAAEIAEVLWPSAVRMCSPAAVPEFFRCNRRESNPDAFEQFHRSEVQTSRLVPWIKVRRCGIQGLTHLIQIQLFPAIDEAPADQLMHQLLSGEVAKDG